MAHPTELPKKVRDNPAVREVRTRLFDRVCFGVGTLAACWLAISLAVETPGLSFGSIVSLVLVWLVVAYLALPRLNRMMAAIYVPDYFIGRTRTSDGLLGDPLNLAVRGTGPQLATAMANADWILADPVTLASSIRIVRSTLTRRSYPRAPVSPLLLFNRGQDAAYQQEVEGNPAQRHHVRFWRTPPDWPLPGGAYVDWLAGGTYDRRVGLSLFTLQITHKIDADIDVERDYIVESLVAANPGVTIDVLSDFTTGYHSRNGGGDSVHTDGDLPVIDVSAVEPDAGASDLRPVPPTSVPPQVWLPVLINLVLAPYAVWMTLRALPGPATDRVLAVAAVTGSVLVAVLAVCMFARNALARQLLLGLAIVVGVAHLSALPRTESTVLQGQHSVGALVAILVLVALSSPKATQWTSGSVARGSQE